MIQSKLQKEKTNHTDIPLNSESKDQSSKTSSAIIKPKEDEIDPAQFSHEENLIYEKIRK